MRRAADAGTALFLSCALANALGAAGLARAFGYPDLLHNPASATLAALGDRVALLTLLAGLTALSAFLLVPLTTRVIRLGHSPPSPTRPQPGPPLSITTAEIRRARAADLTTIAEPRPAAGDHSAPSDQSAVSDQLAVSGPSTGGDHSDAGAGEGTPRAGGGRAAPWLLLGVALAASTTMIFECSLWLVGVPMLAHPAEIPGRIAPEVLTFDALRVVAGVGCGETLGPLLLAIWTGLVATRFTDRLAGAHGTSGGWNQPAYAVPRRSGLAGLLLART